MSTKAERVSELGARFWLGDWQVEPSLNRVSRGDTAVQVERKAMDVLVYLAGRAGEVVSHAELQDAVWQTEFVSYNTVTNRISELREALEDDARDPRYIETVPKRGYRLIAEVSFGASAEPDVEAFADVPRERADERPPYPGLAPFDESDVEDFFGREAEIAALWRKITSRRLLAVIGASGAGKSSLLRAGIVARPPPGWRAVVCQPGEEPFLDVARALAPDLMDDAEEMRRLLAFHDSDMALAVAARWRGRWDEALLVVDQFEELFTLNPEPVRERFAGLLRRLVDAAGIHVVLVLRDDFLLECHRYPQLEPIFSDLTPLGPPAGRELRRALTEPAARRLYAFESESIVDEMVGEVEAERGALPLLAFAVSRLWELRDRERRLLTREAYEQIGGVGGALAQHAEATLEAIGPDRLPVVRELFRNLVTAQGTRAVRDVGRAAVGVRRERMPCHPERGGRRPASRGIPPATDGVASSESLHASGDPSTPRPSEGRSAQDDRRGWRRGAGRVDRRAAADLLRGPRGGSRADTPGRDRPRVAARELAAARALADPGRGRRPAPRPAPPGGAPGRSEGQADDLLWTGTSYREYEVWRARYPGGLTELEEAFAAAMTALATRRRRRRRIARARRILGAAGRPRRRDRALVATAACERDPPRRGGQAARPRPGAARRRPHRGARPDHREPGGRRHREAREFVMRALWAAPPALELDMGAEQLPSRELQPGRPPRRRGRATRTRCGCGPRTGRDRRARRALHQTIEHLDLGRGGPGRHRQGGYYGPAFGDRVQLWSIPDGKLLRTIDFASPAHWQVGRGRLFALIGHGEGTERRVELKSWRLPDGPEELLDTPVGRGSRRDDGARRRTGRLGLDGGEGRRGVAPPVRGGAAGEAAR